MTKRLVPIGIGALVLFILWRLIRRAAADAGFREILARSASQPLGSNLCSTLPGPSSASTPVSRAAATARSSAISGRLRGHRVRRDPHLADDPLPERLLALDDELRGAGGTAPAVGVGGRARPVPEQRAHRDVGRAGERARARGRRPRRRPGHAVQPQRGEARGHRRRARRQARGADDGHAPALAARDPEARRRGRRAGARVLPSRARPHARSDPVDRSA